MRHESFLAGLGVAVVEVPNLDVEVCYVEDRRVGLIREGLSDHARLRALLWLLEAAGQEFLSAS